MEGNAWPVREKSPTRDNKGKLLDNSISYVFSSRPKVDRSSGLSTCLELGESEDKLESTEQTRTHEDKMELAANPVLDGHVICRIN